jgi:hypothetical protein
MLQRSESNAVPWVANRRRPSKPGSTNCAAEHRVLIARKFATRYACGVAYTTPRTSSRRRETQGKLSTMVERAKTHSPKNYINRPRTDYRTHTEQPACREYPTHHEALAHSEALAYLEHPPPRSPGPTKHWPTAEPWPTAKPARFEALAHCEAKARRGRSGQLQKE